MMNLAQNKLKKAAALGGEPMFTEPLGIVRPLFPELSRVANRVGEILRTGQLTNLCQYAPALEAKLNAYLEGPRCIAVANGTLGLLLTLAGLKLAGEVIVPSFTFSATAHAVKWAGLEPVFADIDPHSFTLDPAAVEAAITPRTSAIVGVHVYGCPCDIEGLQRVAQRHGLALLFDSAHAFGSRYRAQKMGGFGEAEVFSFHATKILPMGEGGGVTTNNVELAEYVALARKFGAAGVDETALCGINAKMQEFNAIIGLENLNLIETWIRNRRQYARLLIERLGRLPGLRFQQIAPDLYMNYQNFAVLVNQADFGLSRDALSEALAAENILARKYFYPPLHLHRAYTAYREKYQGTLPVTKKVANEVLCLPLYSQMREEMIEGLCRAIESIHHQAGQLRLALSVIE